MQMLTEEKKPVIRKSFIRFKKKTNPIQHDMKPRTKVSHLGNLSRLLMVEKQERNFSQAVKPRARNVSFPIIKLSSPDLSESLIDLGSPKKERDNKHIKRMKKFGEAFNKVK